jgi:hypothetical protein
MLTRRQLIIGAIGAAFSPLSFYEKAFSHYENFGEALLIPPSNPTRILNVASEFDLEFCLGNVYEEPPTMKWREYLQRYWQGNNDEDEWRENWGDIDFEAKADPWVVTDSWCLRDSPAVKAYYELDKLLPELSRVEDSVRGELLFYDGPAPGSNYRGVQASSQLSISLLQVELNRLNSGFLIKVI